eukprot:g2425.t1
MLEEQHPNLRLPEGVTSLIVEVVRPEVQVCVPYSYQGFRLLAVMKEGAWLWEDAADAMAQEPCPADLVELGMERPKRLSFEHVKPRGYGAGEAPSLSDVMAKAQAYVMGEDPHTLEEGWVVVFRNGLRLKVHTEVWNMVHAWWSNRINTKTVLPLLEDPRINQVPFSSLRECLCGPAATEKRRQNADALEALLRKLKPIYEETRFFRTRRVAAELKVNGHPLVKIIQMVRGRQGSRFGDAAAEQRGREAHVPAACCTLLRAVQMCLEVLPKNTTVPALEKDLQKPLPEDRGRVKSHFHPQEMVPLISGKGLILPDAFQRLTAVLARRTVAPEASRCKSDEIHCEALRAAKEVGLTGGVSARSLRLTSGCQASSGSVAPVQSEWQLAARQVPGVVKIDGLVPETSYEIQCMARLQDEPTVLSTWLPAGSLVTLKDLDVDLTLLYLRVQPLCASKPIEAYDVQVQPALQSGRANYTVALPNADFIALNCTEQEAEPAEPADVCKWRKVWVTWCPVNFLSGLRRTTVLDYTS